jgi:integrase
MGRRSPRVRLPAPTVHGLLSILGDAVDDGITAAWTGCRWGELAALQRHNTHLDDRLIVIDPDIGALKESASRQWLGPPKTAASARTRSKAPHSQPILDQARTSPQPSKINHTNEKGSPTWRNIHQVNDPHRSG